MIHIQDIIKLLEDAKRYFEHSGMHDYRIENIEVLSKCWVRITFVEISPEGKEKALSALEFSNGYGSLNIEIPVTGQEIFDFADEFGWDEKTVHYIQYGVPLKREKSRELNKGDC